MAAKKVRKILIVEDEKPLAKALELKLGKAGYETTVAANGGDAVDALDAKTYDLMILDLVMPRFDGFHVLQHMHDKGISIKTLVLSNLSQAEDIKKAKQFGATEYFVKSNTPIITLVQEVDKALH